MKALRRSLVWFITSIVVVAVFIGIFFISTQPKALSVTIDTAVPAIQNYNEFVEAVLTSAKTGKLSSELKTMQQVGELAGGIGAGVAGVGGEQGSIQGAIPAVSNSMAYLYEKPAASTGDYIADLIQHNNLVRPAYAQGLGFQALSNVLPIWKTFRDISYMLFTIIFLVIGFFIIFRQKIDGHTVANISNALPNLIISLVLITFSYAIAGFIIDLMYVAIFFIIWIGGQFIDNPIALTSPTYGNVKVSLQDLALSNNIFALGFNLVFGTGGGAQSDHSFVGGASAAVSMLIRSFFSSSDRTGQLMGQFIGPTAQIIAFAVFAVAIFFAIIRTFFQLLTSYISFIIGVILSPIQLLLGAVSGQSTFTSWIRGLVANLAPFPVVIAMIIFAMGLTGFGKKGVGFQAASTGGGGAEAVGGFQAPLITLGDSGSPDAAAAVQGLIGFGLVMLIPEAVKMSKEFFKANSALDKYMGTIGNNAKMGWTGGQALPGIGPNIGGVGGALKSARPSNIANAIPIGLGESIPFRTTGKETGLERLLIGTRQQRAKEVDYQRQAALFGKKIRRREGGIYGAITNERGVIGAAKQQRGGGAGSNKP